MQDLSMGCVTEVVNSEEKLYTETANFVDSGKSHILPQYYFLQEHGTPKNLSVTHQKSCL